MRLRDTLVTTQFYNNKTYIPVTIAKHTHTIYIMGIPGRVRVISLEGLEEK